MKINKHLSVFALYARSSLFKILGIMALTFISEGFFFKRAFEYAVKMYYERWFTQLEVIFDNSHTDLIFALSFLLITLALCTPTCQFSSQTGYTMKRLSISEKSVFLCQTAYNFFVYFVFLALQVAFCYLLSLYYMSASPAEAISEQTVFLAFYRSKFLHSLLPLSDISLWLRNLFLLIIISFGVSEFSFKNRRKKFSVMTLFCATYCLFTFNRDIGDFGNMALSFIIMLIVIADSINCVFFRNYEEEEEAQSYE